MSDTKVGVVGAGNIGISVVVDLLLHGSEVNMVDCCDSQLEHAREQVSRLVKFAPVLDSSLPRIVIDDATRRLRATKDIASLAKCGFVVENVFEDWEVKREVYRELSEVCGEDTIIGANTSCLSITKIASASKHPQNILGMHFMNPSYLKKTVEVIRGMHTSEDSLQKSRDLLAKMGKKAVIVEDLPGFVSNRISHLFMNEAAFVVQDQVAKPKVVDELFRDCFGHKMGPLETADLIGLDTVVKSLDVLYDSYQDSKFRCCPLMRKMVDGGRLGKKVGHGFYKYAD